MTNIFFSSETNKRKQEENRSEQPRKKRRISELSEQVTPEKNSFKDENQNLDPSGFMNQFQQIFMNYDKKTQNKIEAKV